MMTDVSSNNKRIAKNTLYLYIRMVIMMAIGLYTSRVVLNTLGVSDFGIYNVMGGIIGMLNYANLIIAGGTSRFLTISIGKEDLSLMKNTFSTSMMLCTIASLVILLLGETIGLWFMNTYLNIPQERMEAANWVYQCALLSACIVVLQSPFNASIMAHEKMDIYAYFSIIESILKLGIVYVLYIFYIDKLKLYAFLLFGASFLICLIYATYCLHKFKECRLTWKGDKMLTRSMLRFSGWGMVSAMAHLLKDNGVNIVLNIFFGTTINAARGIAMQINGVVQKFYSNFQVAANPQIYKYYAQGELDKMTHLICNNSLFCSLLLICMIVPIMVNIEGILLIWLGQIPSYTPEFVWLMLLQILFYALDLPVGNGITAVGKMKLPALLTSSVYMLIFPFTIICIKLGAGPTISNIIFMCLTPIILGLDVWVLHKYTNFNYKFYFRDVVLRVCAIFAVSIFFAYCIKCFFLEDCWYHIIISCSCSLLIALAFVWAAGIKKSQKKRIINKIKQISIIKKSKL